MTVIFVMSTTTFISHWGMWAANSESAYGTSDRFHPAGWCLLRWQLNGDVIFPVLNKQMWIWPGENENIEILISHAFLFGIILSGIIYSNNIVLYLYALFTQVCCLLYSFLLFVKLCCLANFNLLRERIKYLLWWWTSRGPYWAFSHIVF